MTLHTGLTVALYPGPFLGFRGLGFRGLGFRGFRFLLFDRAFRVPGLGFGLGVYLDPTYFVQDIKQKSHQGIPKEVGSLECR